jgi:quercetin dioxygenase-like cupin family protein
MADMIRTHRWGGIPERMVEPMSGAVLEFDLADEMKTLHRELEWQAFGRNSKTLVKQPDLRVVLTALRQGVRIDEHTTRARICVQTLSGHILMRAGGRIFDVPQGQLVALDWALPRDIEALEDSAFLMTLTWHDGAAE